MVIMLNAEETRDLERAALHLRSAAAAAFSMGMDEDQVYALVEAGVGDAHAWAATTRMQARNSGPDRIRPDGADRYASRV
jgi:hypothetical protein